MRRRGAGRLALLALLAPGLMAATLLPFALLPPRGTPQGGDLLLLQSPGPVSYSIQPIDLLNFDLSRVSTWTGRQTFSGGLAVPYGSSPASPTNGQVWATSSGLFAQIAGGAIGPFCASGCGGGGGAVTSFDSRTGAITFGWSDVSGLVGSGSSTLAAGNDARFNGPPQNSQSAAYSFAVTDAGGQVLHPSSDTTARTWTLNAALGWAVPTKIDLVNDCGAGTITIAISGGALEFFPSGSTGSRTLAPCGEAVLSFIGGTKWAITGTGVS